MSCCFDARISVKIEERSCHCPLSDAIRLLMNRGRIWVPISVGFGTALRPSEKIFWGCKDTKNRTDS